MRRFPLLTTTLLTVALALPAGADRCETHSTTEPEVTFGPYYVDTTCDIEWCPVIWIYEETNGIDGLQRGDAQACASSSSLRCGGDELVDDTCHSQIAADTIIF